MEDSPESPREWDNLGTMVCWHRRYNLGDEQIESRDEWLAGVIDELYDNDGGEEWDEFIEQVEYGVEEAVEKAWELFYEKAIVMNLYLYDHSGITISTTPFACHWDSGKVGYIYVLKSRVFDETSPIGILHAINKDYVDWREDEDKRVKPEGMELFEKIKEAFEKNEWIAEMTQGAEKYLDGEVETYDQYLCGEIYGFVLTKKCDSCGNKHEEIDSVWGFYGDDYGKNGMKGHIQEEYHELFDEL